MNNNNEVGHLCSSNPNIYANTEHVKELWFYLEDRWKLKREIAGFFILTRSKDTVYQHVIIAIILGWWMFFIPNLFYHFLSKETKRINKKYSSKPFFH